jgi:hypothetical protein
MRRFLSFAAVVCFTIPAVAAQGQTALNTSWKCTTVEPVSAVPVTGQADHAYSVYAVKCSATKGSIAGVKEKEGTATEFAESMGNNSKGHGIFVETLSNGDMITYEYQASGVMNDKKPVSASNTWTMTSGTGKAKGIKGSGSCKGKGNPDGSLSLDCTGTYTAGK